ncbi:MAG TPA: anion transporter [Planctomycetota bacterium]|nr:anion transporter [Planctomycetota bacterium]
MTTIVLVIFCLVYLGLIAGALPGLALDRSGIALLGAIALVSLGVMTPEAAWSAIDVPTIALLFGLMVVSSQFRLSGFYAALSSRYARAGWSPERLLLVLIVTSGVLSAVLVNDIVCLALAPIVIEIATARRFDPVPFLLGVAAGSNVGSAATLIGNPQNMLIGQQLDLSFSAYLATAGPVAIVGLGVTWWVIARRYRGRFKRETKPFVAEKSSFDVWQTSKGVVVLLLVIAAFLFGPWPRENVALTAAGVMLLSRKLASSRFMGLIDWSLLIMFVGLFVVHHALEITGLGDRALAASAARGADLAHPGVLFAATALLSNLVSNVPAVMLLLPAAKHPLAGPILALSSTLAGNLLLVGSIANLIVVEQAARLGIKITWRDHARVGVPITLITLAIAVAWLGLVANQ